MRLLTWIPIIALFLLIGTAWIAFRSERPFTFAFDEPPVANTLADPLIHGMAGGDETITGTLLNKDGRPVREALIKLQQGDRLHWTHSDGEGRFKIAEVPPGTHLLTVVARDHLPVQFEALAGEAALELKLTTPAPQAPSIPASMREDLVLNLRSLSEGVDRSRFELLLTPLEDDVRSSPMFPRWGTFDAQGECVLPEVARGRYRAIVLPSWAHGGSWPDLLTDLDGPGRIVEHPGDPSPQLELRSGEIRGRITDVQVPANQGVEFIAGALVLVRPASNGDDPDPRIWPSAQSDPQGAFLLRDLPPGRYLVTAHVGSRRIDREVTVYAAATTTLDL